MEEKVMNENPETEVAAVTEIPEEENTVAAETETTTAEEPAEVENTEVTETESEPSIELNVKIGTKELFSFLMKHTYSGLSGVIGLVISVAALVLFLLGFAEGDPFRIVVLLFLASLFTIVNPAMLWVKAKGQSVKNPLYKDELHYFLNEKEVGLNVNGKKEVIEWSRIMNCKKTKSVYILYTTKIHAILLPVSGMNENKEKIDDLIARKVIRKK